MNLSHPRVSTSSFNATLVLWAKSARLSPTRLVVIGRSSCPTAHQLARHVPSQASIGKCIASTTLPIRAAKLQSRSESSSGVMRRLFFIKQWPFFNTQFSIHLIIHFKHRWLRAKLDFFRRLLRFKDSRPGTGSNLRNISSRKLSKPFGWPSVPACGTFRLGL